MQCQLPGALQSRAFVHPSRLSQCSDGVLSAGPGNDIGQLVEVGGRIVVGKPEARRRFIDLIADDWSTGDAAAEVGVNVRTARDWRDGIRRAGPGRIHSDGAVVDYVRGTRYKSAVTKIDSDGTASTGDR
ncbi:helix-turn-helix domain-containing protein [Rhodococcus sp. NPDC055112]